MSWAEIEVYAHDQRTHPERGCCTPAGVIYCVPWFYSRAYENSVVEILIVVRLLL